MDNGTLVARPAVEIAPTTADFAISSPDCTIVNIVSAPQRVADLRGLASSKLGCELPHKPSLTAGDGFEFVWTGPDRWLAIGSGLPEPSMGKLASVFAETASLVDVSDAYAFLRLNSPKANEAMMKLLPIDLDPSAFPSGAVALTHIGHVGVIVIQRGPGPIFDVLVPRSFAAGIVGRIEHA